MRRALLTVLLLTACRGQPTSPADGWVVTTTVAPGAVRVGTTITVTVLLINHTNEVRTIETNQCTFFSVTTADGTVVGPAARLCAAFSRPKTFVPGEQYVFTDHWSGDAAGGTFGAPTTFVGEGSYYARGLPSLPTAVNLPAPIQILR